MRLVAARALMMCCLVRSLGVVVGSGDDGVDVGLVVGVEDASRVLAASNMTNATTPMVNTTAGSSSGNGRVWWRRWRDHMRPSKVFGKNRRTGWPLALWLFIWFAPMIVVLMCCCAVCKRIPPMRCKKPFPRFLPSRPWSMRTDDSTDSCAECLCECCGDWCDCMSRCCARTSRRIEEGCESCGICCVATQTCCLRCCCGHHEILKVYDNSQKTAAVRKHEDELDEKYGHGLGPSPPRPVAPPFEPRRRPEPGPHFARVGDYWTSRLPASRNAFAVAPSLSPHRAHTHIQDHRTGDLYAPYAHGRLPPLPAAVHQPMPLAGDPRFVGHGGYPNYYGYELPPLRSPTQREINEAVLNGSGIDPYGRRRPRLHLPTQREINEAALNGYGSPHNHYYPSYPPVPPNYPMRDY